MKRWMIIALVVCFILPQAALAEETPAANSSLKWQFSDTTSHWAKKHISKIALLGFAQGTPEGKYLPGNKISQQDAVIMVINMLGLDKQIDKNSDVALGFDVPTYARPYVLLALNEKLIDRDSSLDNAWGSKDATREWITKLIVRSIGQQSQADAAIDEETGFTDSWNISEGYTGYINVAKSMGIVNGNDDGSFKPTDNVTRAQMAVFLGNAEKHLTQRSSRISSGTVISFNGVSLTIQDTSGSVRTLSVHPDAGFYNNDSNNPILPSDIDIDDFVTVIHQQGIAYYTEISDKTISLETITGTMESISLETQIIILKVNGVSRAYRYAANASVITASGSGMSLSSIPAESTLELKRESGDITAEITQIIVKDAPVYQTVNGTVQSVSTTSNVVEVMETSTGIITGYQIPAALTITSGERTLSGLSELYVDDEVEVELKDGIVTSFTVIKSGVAKIEGKVHSVTSDNKSILLLGADNKLDGYFVGQDIQVTINGMNTAEVQDIQVGDEVVLELGSDNLVNKILVKNRSIEAQLGIEFSIYDPDLKSVVLKDKNGWVIKEMTDSTKVLYNGINVTLDKVNSYFTMGKKVDIIFSGNRIAEMNYSLNYTGIITDINTVTNTIKLNTQEYGSATFTYSSTPFIEIFGKNSTSIADIKLGDSVQITLDTNQDKANFIRLFQKQLYKVTAKYSYKLTVVDEEGASLDINGTHAVPITHFEKTSPTYNDITNETYVMVSFTGSTPSNLYVPKVTWGTVTAVDAVKGSFVYSESGKNPRTVTGNNNVKIVRNSTVSSSLSALTANDRIQLVEGKDGLRWIAVIPPQSKTFLGYNNQTKIIELFRATISENNRFELDENAYIHKGTQELSPLALARNDKLIVYFLGDKIIEIEKL